jgi:hypothetical protein
MMTNPVPGDFSSESITLLYNLKETPNEALLITIPVTYLLMRKWNKYGYAFYVA